MVTRTWIMVGLALGVASCDGNEPYLTTSGEGRHYTVVIDGVDVGS